jgi:ATP-dependent Lhr-like helicase
MTRETQYLSWIESWFKQKHWDSKEFQRKAWAHYLQGDSGLISVSTGFGKTYAGILGAIAEMNEEKVHPRGIHILYISPLRALNGDIQKSLKLFLDENQLPFTVGIRTGDTSSYERTQQKKNPPSILITTPESFNLLLATEDYRKSMEKCRLVIVDEWHELMGNKRGVQVQLCLNHLKKISPKVRVWGLSATIGNPALAGEVLNGSLNHFVFISEKLSKEIDIQCLLPDEIDSFPWAGHLGMAMMEKVMSHLDLTHSCLIFTNTRNQAERWYNEILIKKPEWSHLMGLHHSSVDRELREKIEEQIKSGELKLVVCTSSLDLGVDFPRVERVYQIGSPKSIARFIQRAGRSGHTPTGVPRIYFVPTHALELFEYLAVEMAVERGLKEDVFPPVLSYDVLAQHLVTLAADEGLDPEKAFEEIRSTYSYRYLTKEQFEKIIIFLTTGGQSLSAYPAYHKLKEKNGKFLIFDKKMIQQHLMNIGTITSDPSIRIRFMNGGNIGSVEESFVGKLKKGDTFVFAGKVLQYVLIKDLTLYVRLAPSKKAPTAIWWGARLPLSSLLCEHLKEVFELIEKGELIHPLVPFLAPITEVQKALSRLPGRNYLLIEETQTREGKHLFIFPFEGKLVHEALAALLSVRLSALAKVTFTFAVSEYGLEILAPKNYVFNPEEFKELLSTENLSNDIQRSLNMTQLAKKQFREIAQVSGLIQQNRAGERRTMKNLQMSSSLLFDVFSAYEPDQLLFHQSYDEVRHYQFQEERLLVILRKLQELPFEYYKTIRPSPLAFPLIIERIGSMVTSENLKERLERMKEKWIET